MYFKLNAFKRWNFKSTQCPWYINKDVHTEFFHFIFISSSFGMIVRSSFIFRWFTCLFIHQTPMKGGRETKWRCRSWNIQTSRKKQRDREAGAQNNKKAGAPIVPWQLPPVPIRSDALIVCAHYLNAFLPLTKPHLNHILHAFEVRVFVCEHFPNILFFPGASMAIHQRQVCKVQIMSILLTICNMQTVRGLWDLRLKLDSSCIFSVWAVKHEMYVHLGCFSKIKQRKLVCLLGLYWCDCRFAIC